MHRWSFAVFAALVFLISGNLSAQTDIDSFAVKLSLFSGSHWGIDPNSNRFAVFSDKKEQLTPYRFESVQPFRNGVAIAVVDGRYQLVYADGSFSDDRFDGLFEVQGGWYYGQNGRDWSILDKKGKPAFTLDIVYPSEWEFFLPIRSGDKVGLLNTSGRMVVKPQYDWISRFIHGISIVGLNGKRGLIDTSGQLVTSLDYDETLSYLYSFYAYDVRKAPSFVKNLWILKKDQKCTLFHKDQGIIPGSTCDFFGRFVDGYAVFRKDKKNGYIDSLGHVAIPAIYDIAYDFLGKLARVGKDKVMGMIDGSGNVVVPLEYQLIADFKNGYYAAIINSNHIEYLDINGKLKSVDNRIADLLDDGDRPPDEWPNKDAADKSEPEWLKGLFHFKSNGYIVARKDNVYGVFDSLGKTIVPYRYEDIYGLKGGFFSYKKNGRWGLLDKSGRELTPAISDQEMHNYDYDHLGLVQFTDNRKVGLINNHGKMKVHAEYDIIYEFSKYGLAVVKNDDMCGIIDTNGNIVVPLKYEYSGKKAFNQDVFFSFCRKRNATDCVYLFVSPDHKVIREYSHADYFENGTAVVQTGDYGDNLKYGLIDLNGREILPLSAKEIRHFTATLAEVNNKSRTEYEIIDLKTGKRKGEIYHGSISRRYYSPWHTVQISGKRGFIDSLGTVIVPLEMDTLAFLDYHTIYRKGTCWGMLDSLLKPELPCNYQYIGHYTDNSLLLKKDNQWQFYELEKTKTPRKKTGAESEMKAVRKNYKWGWEDASGKTVIPYIFDAVKPFQDGKAWVFCESFGRPVRINTKGEIILEYYP